MIKKVFSIITSFFVLLTTCLLVGSISSVKSSNKISNSENKNLITKNNVLMLDVARRYMSRNQILDCIRNVNPSKFKFVQLHLNDNENYAIKSSILHNAKMKDTLSQDDLKVIVNFANQKGITIIPDIDVPSHDTALINDLKQSHSPWLKYNITMDNSTFDYTNPKTLELVESLYDEILPIFKNQPFRFFMIGADEVPGNVSCAIQFSNFLNNLNEFLNRNGFKAIVWNDSLNSKVLKNLDRNITVDYWEQSDAHTTMEQIAEHGNPVKNANYQNSYFNTVDLRNQPLRNQKAKALGHQKGSKMLCLWGSDSSQENQINNQDVISYINQVQNNL